MKCACCPLTGFVEIIVCSLLLREQVSSAHRPRRRFRQTEGDSMNGFCRSDASGVTGLFGQDLKISSPYAGPLILDDYIHSPLFTAIFAMMVFRTFQFRQLLLSLSFLLLTLYLSARILSPATAACGFLKPMVWWWTFVPLPLTTHTYRQKHAKTAGTALHLLTMVWQWPGTIYSGSPVNLCLVGSDKLPIEKDLIRLPC